MKKVKILILALFMVLLGVTANAASDTEQIFSNYLCFILSEISEYVMWPQKDRGGRWFKHKAT